MKRFLLLLLLTVACAAPSTPDLRGAWGGNHISLTITDAASSVEFDCAGGAIPGAFTVDASGRFSMDGTYTPGVGGPEPIEPFPVLDAIYSGRVMGQRMALTVDLEGDLPTSTFTLRQGEPPQILACL